MKKITSCILLIFIFATMISFNSVPGIASPGTKELNIISPGETCTTDLSKIEVECADAQKLIYELNGEIIGETDGVEEISLSEPLTAGNHTLKVTALFSDGTGVEKEQLFKAEKYILKKKSTQNFNSLTSQSMLSDVKLSLVNKQNAAGKNFVSWEPAEGRSGSDGDYSFKLYYTQNDNNEWSLPYVSYTDFAPNKIQGIMTAKFSIKASDGPTSLIQTYHFPMVGSSIYALYKDSTIYGQSYSVPKNDWLDIELYQNHMTNYKKVKVNGITIREGEHVTTRLWSETRFAMGQIGARTDSTRAAYYFDNFDFTWELVYGMKKLSYITSDGSWTEYTGQTVPSNITKLKLELTESMNPAQVTKDTVKLFENGAEVPVTSVSCTDNVIEVQLSRELSKDASVSLKLDKSITLASGDATDSDLVARFKTDTPPLTPRSVVFKKDGYKIYSASQVSTGDTVSVDVELKNDTAEARNMSVILYIVQNKKLRGIAGDEYYLNAGQSLPVTVTIPSLSQIDADGAITVRMSLCDTLEDTIPYMTYTEIK